MFETLTDADERGQVGIGTLIIFIAMVLVAAIAAGVLINTAGVLQSQASTTGSETQEAVANQIEVVHAVGNVSTDADYVDRLNFTIKQSAGAGAIDISSMTVQYTSDEEDTTLVYRGADVTYDEATESDITAGDTVNDHPELDHASDSDLGNVAGNSMGLYAADSGHFTTFGVNNGDAHLTNTDERITMTINATVIEAPSSHDKGLEGGDDATIKLIDQSGAQFTYGVSVPSTFGNKQVVEV
ncbi:archaellin/type IV pilin N-terminal domain-containing protein [Halomontanus rarus]|uniref:archaellin/type IV pilin N-terminal domain-containing protein n=1 Tax=Halomontanus rarus TaxID=3034020 RepID=UPI001A98AE8A